MSSIASKRRPHHTRHLGFGVAQLAVIVDFLPGEAEFGGGRPHVPVGNMSAVLTLHRHLSARSCAPSYSSASRRRRLVRQGVGLDRCQKLGGARAPQRGLCGAVGLPLAPRRRHLPLVRPDLCPAAHIAAGLDRPLNEALGRLLRHEGAP